MSRKVLTTQEIADRERDMRGAVERAEKAEAEVARLQFEASEWHERVEWGKDKRQRIEARVAVLEKALGEIASFADAKGGDTDPDSSPDDWKDEAPILWICYRANIATAPLSAEPTEEPTITPASVQGLTDKGKAAIRG